MLGAMVRASAISTVNSETVTSFSEANRMVRSLAGVTIAFVFGLPMQTLAQSAPLPKGPHEQIATAGQSVSRAPQTRAGTIQSKADLNRIGGNDSGTDVRQGVTTARNSLSTATMPRTIAERAMTDAQPQDFLSEGQSVSDLVNRKIDVGALINRAFAAGVARVRLPCGNYLITTTIRMGSMKTLMGDGMCTALFSTSSNEDVLDVSGAFSSIRDLRFVNASTKSGGAVIAAVKTFHLAIDHIAIDAITPTTYWWNGIALYGANDTHINDSEIRPAGRNSAIQLSGTSATGRSEDSYVTHTNLNGWQNNFELSWASGNYLSNMDILSARKFGVLFDPSPSQEVDGTRASQVLSDSNTADGWRFDGSGPITETALTNCWSSTNGYRQKSAIIIALADGLHVINPNTNNLTVLSSEFHANTAHGVEISAGKNILLSGNTLFMNGAAGRVSTVDTKEYSLNSYSGIFIDTAASYVTAIYNIGGMGGVSNVGAVNHQRYLIDNASVNYVTISLNMGNTHWGGSVVNVSAPALAKIINVNNNGN